MDIYLSQLGNESPKEVNMAMKSIYKNNKKEIKNIESKRFGIQFLLKGIYIQNDLLYFHTEVKNSSNVPFDLDFVRWKIVDKKVAKRTAIQETAIEPVRAFHFVTKIQGRSLERTVFAMNKFTIPDDKKLVVELFEKNGGRHQSFDIGNDDIVHAVFRLGASKYVRYQPYSLLIPFWIDMWGLKCSSCSSAVVSA